MAQTIAIAGKGGTGKTTISGLLIHYLSKMGKGPVLAVDTDANSNLNEVLGVEVETTLGSQEDAKSEMMTQPYTSWHVKTGLCRVQDDIGSCGDG